MKIKLLVQDEYAILRHLGPVDISKLLEIPILGNTLISMKPGLENLKLIYPAIEILEHNTLIPDIRWFQENEVVDSKYTIEAEITEIIEILNFILTSFTNHTIFNSVIKTKENYKRTIIKAALCNYYINKLGENCEENTWKIIRKEAINWFYGMLQNKY